MGESDYSPKIDFMDPIYPDDVKIVGKAVGLFRKL